MRTEHDADDPGGTTRYGIDKRSHPHEDIEHLTKDRAIEIYWSEWNEAGCDAMPAKFGEVYFNARVNCGAGRAEKLRVAAKRSAARFVTEQGAFYNRLVAARPRSQKYLKGWTNRLNDLRRFLSL